MPAPGAPFEVRLCSYPPEHKIRVIRAIRELTGLGLAEAKAVSERVLPTLLYQGNDRTRVDAAFGLFAKTVEGASNLPLPIFLLPFLGSGFVPAESMPAGLSWFAEYQPFTPVIDTLRACLDGRDPGSDAWWAIGWCVLVTVVCYAWARRLFARVRAV